MGIDKAKTRRGYATLKAVDPRDGKDWDVLLSEDLMKYTARRGMGAAMELADIVRSTLLKPSAIFSGVRKPFNDKEDPDSLCYVGLPGKAFDYRTGAERPAWSEEVFLVFANSDRVVYLWYWDKCDPDNRRLPINHSTRFKEQLI